MLARLEHVQGHPEKAQEAMRAAEQLASEYHLSPRRSIWVKSPWRACGLPKEIWRELPISFSRAASRHRTMKSLTCASLNILSCCALLLAQGDYDAALALSERLLQKAEATNRMGRVIEILVLQALAFQGKKDMAQALAISGKGSFAGPAGRVRAAVFLDEGEPMAKLLYQAKSHRIGAGYAAELLSAMGKASGTALPPAQLLIEPLSLRELEVLKLIEAGYSNQEIAAKLVISIPTVKRHISNIYAKLGAKSRTQAVSLGRELRLFE